LFAGFVLKAVHEKETSELSTKIKTLSNQVEVAPKLIKELTHDINSILGNFVTNLASVTVSSKPVQPKSPEANTGDVKRIAGATKKSSEGSAKTFKPSTKSAE
jgi:hypothetical protein